MGKGTFFFAGWILLVTASTAFSGEPPKDGKDWKDQAEFSFVNTTGNTGTRSLAGKNLLTYRFTPKTTGSWKIAGLNSREDGRTTAENYSTELRFDRAFTQRIYAYVHGGWNKDRFAGLDRRLYGGGGAGRKFLSGPAHFLTGEAGLNRTREDYTDGTRGGFLTGRAFAKYEYACTEKTRFQQSLEFLYDFSDSEHYKVNSETAVVATLTDVFSLKAGYVVRYDNKPVPEEVGKTDTETSIALVANF